MRKSGEDLYDLTVSNATEALADYPHEQIAHAFGKIVHFRYQPEALGSMAAREQIAGWYERRHIAVTPDQIALTASSSESYAVLFKLLCDAGDEILVPCPSYPLFEYLARAEGVEARPYDLLYDGGWFIDWHSVEAATSARTRAIVIVNPNNPTGSYLKRKEAERLHDLAARHRLVIVSDEVFMTYPAGGGSGLNRVNTLIEQDQTLSFSLNGLSKAACMPQMKLGWIVVGGPRDQRAAALEKVELLLDNYLSVGTPVQQALPDLLKIGDVLHERIAGRLGENRAALRVLQGSAAQPLESEGGWSAVLQIPNILPEEEWIMQLLRRDRIIVQPGYFYDMAKEAFLVVSLITDPAVFAAGLKKMRQAVG